LLLTVLIRGGNTRTIVMASSVLAMVCLSLGAVVACSTGRRVVITVGNALYALAMVGLLVIALAALVPLSPETWLSLPGRAAYAELVALLRQPPMNIASLSLSFDPVGTSYATLSVLLALSVGMAAMLLPATLLLSVLALFVGIAIAEAALGLLQVVFGTPSFLAYDVAVGGNRAAGTFVNKNHYATLLAMALPLLIFRTAGQFHFSQRVTTRSTLSSLWWGVATATVATALVASLSRAGSAAGFSVAVLATLMCGLRKQATTRQRFGLLGIAVLALALASTSSLTLLLDSLTGATFADSAEGRKALVRLSMIGATSFFPVGSGLGSFSIAFQRFQADGVTGFIEHVHNDYVELLFEAGILGCIVLICFVIAAVATGVRLWKSQSETQPLSPAIACWLGALAFAIHAWFDFPSHIPGLTIVVSLLFGASMNGTFVKPAENPTDVPSKRRSSKQRTVSPSA
jgi:O-antigen ligase